MGFVEKVFQRRLARSYGLNLTFPHVFEHIDPPGAVWVRVLCNLEIWATAKGCYEGWALWVRVLSYFLFLVSFMSQLLCGELPPASATLCSHCKSHRGCACVFPSPTTSPPWWAVAFTLRAQTYPFFFKMHTCACMHVVGESC